jgi:hypothetical protein
MTLFDGVVKFEVYFWKGKEGWRDGGEKWGSKL